MHILNSADLVHAEDGQEAYAGDEEELAPGVPAACGGTLERMGLQLGIRIPILLAALAIAELADAAG